MRSIRRATSVRGSPTPCCRLPESATQTGATPGFRSSAPSWGEFSAQFSITFFGDPELTMAKFILALDQGTTSSRAIVFDHAGSIVAVAQKEFPQIFPKPGWVEHDPREIWSSQAGVAAEALTKANAAPTDIAAIGITNQREIGRA